LLAAGAVGLVALGVLASSQMFDGVVRALGGVQGSALSIILPMAGTTGVMGTTQALATGGLTGWQYLGPNNVGGPTSHITYDPGNASVLYAMSYGGDVFRSSDAGASWQFLSHVPLRGARLEVAHGQSQTCMPTRIRRR
jgi:hypothetical protein